ncbi:MAG: hypothetical protein R2828_28270 [Saprospiraceae bacterium]
MAAADVGVFGVALLLRMSVFFTGELQVFFTCNRGELRYLILVLLRGVAFGDLLLQSLKSRQNARQKNSIPQTVFCQATRAW